MNEARSIPRIIRRAILVLVALGILVLALVQNRQERTRQLPVYGAIPDFSLIAEDNRAFSRADLMGKVVVVDFIFTRCAGVCPIMSAEFSKLQSTFVRDEDVHLVSISVDPDHDSPEVLRDFGKQYNASGQQWTFLTGNKGAIFGLSREGFRLGVAEDGGSMEEPIIHSSKIVLLDRQSRIRGYYEGTDQRSVRQLVRDMRTLLEEPQ